MRQKARVLTLIGVLTRSAIEDSGPVGVIFTMMDHRAMIQAPLPSAKEDGI